MIYDTAVCLPELQQIFARDARRVTSHFDKPEAWRSDRVLILLLSVSLHGLGWWVWQQATIPATAPRLLNSIEVALVSPQPEARPAPPVPKPEKPQQEAPKPKLKPKPVTKAAKPTEAKPEESASAPAAPSAPAPTATASNMPFVEADYRADYLHNPAPKYPETARQRHWEGLVLLRVRVLTDGSSGEVLIDRSSGHAVLDETAVEAAHHWNFVPAKRGEETIAAWVIIPIEFKLKN